MRRIYEDSEEDTFNQKKIRLPEKLENLLCEKIISDFDTEENEKKTEELIRAERDALLGVTKEVLDNQDIIDLITKKAQTATAASELIFLFENEKPWYIWPFFYDLHRLSLLVAFYHGEKKLLPTSAFFYEQLASYLINQSSNTTPIRNVNSIVEMFSEFAFDMMRKGQIIFSGHTIETHPAFKDKLETGQINLDMLLSFPFIVQRGKWYEFQTLAFQAYLSLKKFLSFIVKERAVSYVDFLNLRDSFLDIEHDIWLLCSELDLPNFNQCYLIPLLKEYLTAIDTTNPKTVCSSTFSFLELTLKFKISRNTLLPDVSGSCCNGLPISALEFIGHDLLKVELYMSCSEEESKNNDADLLRLGRCITQQGSLTGYEEDEYELDLAKHSANPELLEILESLGVCDFL
ncbi:hypothetical protein CathTA2_1210 [Caldalkalibacillus thermarum TA2.A1]|uniref:Uncharacterized protein n=1 Tax=Caldalkalibacillus thermarum (strain TA2.A1) TaxID=986075 RepID=F5L5Z7_CALTT|nr:hypothetical protein [Caldalkalibacillus thermarum]EGL83238.1 hypothetical protein CathTA2_1210 [Caldalkalibacillus thermarum TA2.A1]QZT35195.1 hypothetical protein HUR95_08315 [Caldalkalibacillus thermarum TA2.A1]